MKSSPVKIAGFEYPLVHVRANPELDLNSPNQTIAVAAHGTVGFSLDGTHFAMVSVRQIDDNAAYDFEFEAFTSFEIDVDACRMNYQKGYTPGMIAVNMARLLYSGVRELLASLTARAPHGVAMLPSTTLGPEDVDIYFEPSDVNRNEILTKFFDYSPERIADLEKRAAEDSASKKKPRKKTPSKRA